MTLKPFAAAIGFAFVAAWIAFGLGDAVLCLIGAAIFTAAAAYWQGELDLVGLRDSLNQRASDVSRSGQRTR